MGTNDDRPISVVLVDDHDLFRSGLAAMLQREPDIAVVGQASRAPDGIRLTAELRPRVVLMDLRMPEMDGLTATREVGSASPESRVLMLAAAADTDDVEAAVHAGACGFLLKDSSLTDVVAAVRCAADGQSWLAPRAASVILARLRRDHAEPPTEAMPVDVLTGRELEVLSLVARGLENAEIAGELCISPSTAKNHLSHVLAKLGITSRVQAAVYAVHHGLG